MPVLTRLGFGESDRKKDEATGMVQVILEKEYQKKRYYLFFLEETHTFGDWALLRMIHVEGHGFFSNLHFFNTREDTVIDRNRSQPEGEYQFGIELRSARVDLDPRFKSVSENERYLIFETQVGTWVPEPSDSYPQLDVAKKAWSKIELMGSEVGIRAGVLIDTEKEKLLGLHLNALHPIKRFYDWNRIIRQIS